MSTAGGQRRRWRRALARAGELASVDFSDRTMVSLVLRDRLSALEEIRRGALAALVAARRRRAVAAASVAAVRTAAPYAGSRRAVPRDVQAAGHRG